MNEKTLADKIATGIVLTCSVLIIPLALLQILGIWENAMYAYIPLACINTLTYAISKWKTQRIPAIMNLVAAIVLLLAFLCMVLARLMES